MIIADEPTGNVDPTMAYEIVDLLTEINKRGTTVIMVTHEHQLVRDFGHRVIMIENGQVVADNAGLSSKKNETPVTLQTAVFDEVKETVEEVAQAPKQEAHDDSLSIGNGFVLEETEQTQNTEVENNEN